MESPPPPPPLPDIQPSEALKEGGDIQKPSTEQLLQARQQLQCRSNGPSSTIVTDFYLNQWEEKLVDGKYERTFLGNKRNRLSPTEKDYFLDKKCCKVIEGLYIGSGDVAMDLDVLKSHQITHILNVSTGIGQCFPQVFTYLCKELNDSPDAPLLDVLEECIAFIDSARNALNGKILVHCNLGVSRSASIVIAYLIRNLKIPYAQAYLQTAQARPVIRPNYGFEKQLQQFADSELAQTK